MDPPEPPLEPLEPPLEPLELPLEPPEPPPEPLEPPWEPPLEPLGLEMELLELLWLLKLLEPPFPRRQGSLGEAIRVGSLQGSKKVPMLLAKVPGEESSG